MTPTTTTMLKYANLQMASEVLIERQLASPGATFFGSLAGDKLKILTDGNTRASRFTETQASEFARDWSVVEHISNTETGFSGTLFKNKKTNELVISIRSTEFADDVARDNHATKLDATNLVALCTDYLSSKSLKCSKKNRKTTSKVAQCEKYMRNRPVAFMEFTRSAIEFAVVVDTQNTNEVQHA